MRKKANYKTKTYVVRATFIAGKKPDTKWCDTPEHCVQETSYDVEDVVSFK